MGRLSKQRAYDVSCWVLLNYTMKVWEALLNLRSGKPRQTKANQPTDSTIGLDLPPSQTIPYSHPSCQSTNGYQVERMTAMSTLLAGRFSARMQRSWGWTQLLLRSAINFGNWIVAKTSFGISIGQLLWISRIGTNLRFKPPQHFSCSTELINGWIEHTRDSLVEAWEKQLLHSQTVYG